MVRWSVSRIGRRLCLTGAASILASFATGHAGAQGKLDARYTASLAGVQIGKGAWVIEIGDDQFTAAASGMTTGLLRVFATGQGSGASRGTVRGDNLNPTSFVSSINNDKRVEELRMVMGGGTIKDFAIEPPTPPNPERVPLTDASRRGVVDPMSAGLMRVAGKGEMMAPEACQRTLAIFDGRMRFDLHLSFKRFERVQAEKGYQGNVVVCGVRFVPVAGHVPDRPAIKYLMAQQDMEMWLAPIPGTRIMVPYRISLQTPLGQGVLEATQFIASATPRTVPATAAAR